MKAEELLRGASALAKHLQRSGVQFLPVADKERATAYRTSFDETEEAPPRREQSADTGHPRQNTSGQPKQRPQPRRLAAATAVHSTQSAYPGQDLPITDRELRLAAMSATVETCDRCPSLVSCRNKTVFGEGHAAPRFAFFGEGPGADEDRTGRPFVGRAGQLLTKMIEACKLSREQVYILNTVKCRPPGNRNPEPEEIQHCREYFESQLSLLRPEYIVCLGAVAAQSLLQSKLSVGRLRGTVHRYFASKVIVTYHPAYLLRNPGAKKAAWQDLQMMLADAGIKV